MCSVKIQIVSLYSLILKCVQGNWNINHEICVAVIKIILLGMPHSELCNVLKAKRIGTANTKIASLNKHFRKKNC